MEGKAKKTKAAKVAEPVQETPDDKLAAIAKEADRLWDVSRQFAEITTEEQVTQATDLLGQIKTRVDRTEELRLFFTKPLNDQLRRINARFKEQSQPLSECYEYVRKAIGSFRMKQQVEARKAEEKRQQEQREEEARARAAAPKAAPVPPPTPVVAPPPPQTMAKTESGAKSVTKFVWRHEILDVGALPPNVRREILELAAEKGLADQVIRRHVAAGVREMTGAQIFEEADVAVHSAR